MPRKNELVTIPRVYSVDAARTCSRDVNRLEELAHVRITANGVDKMENFGFRRPSPAGWVKLGLKRRDRGVATEWNEPDFGPTAETKSGRGSSPPDPSEKEKETEKETEKEEASVTTLHSKMSAMTLKADGK